MVNSELLCNMIYKSKIYDYNNDEIRMGIIELFKSKFKDVWFTAYDDIIVACDICGEAVFISQLGVFRYWSDNYKRFISLMEYKKSEYILSAISMDIYDNNLEKSLIPDDMKHEIVPLIMLDENGRTMITDKSISEEYLIELFEKLSLFRELIDEAKSYYEEYF